MQEGNLAGGQESSAHSDAHMLMLMLMRKGSGEKRLWFTKGT